MNEDFSILKLSLNIPKFGVYPLKRNKSNFEALVSCIPRKAWSFPWHPSFRFFPGRESIQSRHGCKEGVSGCCPDDHVVDWRGNAHARGGFDPYCAFSSDGDSRY